MKRQRLVCNRQHLADGRGGARAEPRAAQPVRLDECHVRAHERALALHGRRAGDAQLDRARLERRGDHDRVEAFELDGSATRAVGGPRRQREALGARTPLDRQHLDAGAHARARRIEDTACERCGAAMHTKDAALERGAGQADEVDEGGELSGGLEIIAARRAVDELAHEARADASARELGRGVCLRRLEQPERAEKLLGRVKRGAGGLQLVHCAQFRHRRAQRAAQPQRRRAVPPQHARGEERRARVRAEAEATPVPDANLAARVSGA
mmetsp:Transcript_2079/g.6704  ORF Transcript_2079/g.6704 Transcript_2079/m.6704 type:complete len:269 (-) Transcript_2079:64-870(-)